MDPLSITARVIAILQLTGTVLGYQQALEQLRSRTDVGNGAQNIKRRLVWKFSKSEVAAILVKDGEAEKPFEHRARERPLNMRAHVNSKLSQAINAKVDALHAGVQAIKVDTKSIRNTQGLQQHHAIMEWVSPTGFPDQQHDIISRRQEGTGQWFVDSPEFKRWLQGSDKKLFCPGIPGAGKTMMAAIAITQC